MEQWSVGECIFDAVWVNARRNIESARTQRFDNYLVSVAEFLGKILNYE
jgi:hypothetical protein